MSYYDANMFRPENLNFGNWAKKFSAAAILAGIAVGGVVLGVNIAESSHGHEVATVGVATNSTLKETPSFTSVYSHAEFEPAELPVTKNYDIADHLIAWGVWSCAAAAVGYGATRVYRKLEDNRDPKETRQLIKVVRNNHYDGRFDQLSYFNEDQYELFNEIVRPIQKDIL